MPVPRRQHAFHALGRHLQPAELHWCGQPPACRRPGRRPPHRPAASLAVKHCVKVRTQRSYRESSGTVIVSGADLVSEIAPHVPLRTLFYLQGSLAPDLPAERCVAVTQAVMLKITGLESIALGALAAEASTLQQT